MNRKQFLISGVSLLCFCAATGMLAPGGASAGETNVLPPGREIEISFADAGLPPTLYSQLQMEIVGEWLRNEVAKTPISPANTNHPNP
jgi:hypothetical protein